MPISNPPPFKAFPMLKATINGRLHTRSTPRIPAEARHTMLRIPTVWTYKWKGCTYLFVANTRGDALRLETLLVTTRYRDKRYNDKSNSGYGSDFARSYVIIQCFFLFFLFFLVEPTDLVGHGKGFSRCRLGLGSFTPVLVWVWRWIGDQLWETTRKCFYAREVL